MVVPTFESDRLRRWVHWILLVGLVVSALFLVAGGFRVLMTGQNRPEGPPPAPVDLLSQALQGRGVDLIDVGLLILMLTPVSRVVLLGVGWLLARQRDFAVVALVVLALLVLSVALGVG